MPNVHEIHVSQVQRAFGKVWVASCKCSKWGTPIPEIASSPLDEEDRYTTFMMGVAIGREFEKHVQPIPIRNFLPEAPFEHVEEGTEI